MKRRYVVGSAMTTVMLMIGAFFFAGSASMQGPETPDAVQAGTEVGADAPAAPSNTLFSYQGQLLNAAGSPITQTAVPITFRLYQVASAGTPCWIENRTVDVQNGLFNVLLGQITALNSSCLAGDVYLELVVNGETLSPRERLTSVVHAVEASTLPNGAATRGDLGIGGNLVVSGSSSVPVLGEYAKWSLTGNKPESVMYGHNLTGAFGVTTQWNSDYVFTGLWDQGYNRKDAVVMWGDDAEDKLRFLKGMASEQAPRELMSLDTSDGLKVVGGLEVGLQDNGGGRLVIGNNPNDNKIFIEGFSADASGSASEMLLTGRYADPIPQISLVANNTSIRGTLDLLGNSVIRVGNLYGPGNQQIHMPPGDDMYINWHSGRSVHFGGGNEGADVSINPNGIDLHGNSIANCGALVEANLQTPQEIEAGRIERFEQGDLLCWSDENQQLELCGEASDPLVMAVADSEGRPIVIGAEPVKVLGQVQAGDYLVASDISGYAMATSTPTFGTVIAQALENFDGDRGLIKAMIRKM